MPILRAFLLGLVAAPAEALAGLYWLVMRRRVRGRRLIWLSATRHGGYYDYWIDAFEPRHSAALVGPRRLAPGSIAALIVPAKDGNQSALEHCAAQARVALGPEATIMSWVSAAGIQEILETQVVQQPVHLAAAIKARCSAQWLVILSAGDRLACSAGPILETALAALPDAHVVYWDEDALTIEGRRQRPWLKPDWDELHFVSRDGITGAAAFNLSALAALSELQNAVGSAGPWQSELTVRAVAAADPAQIRHLPCILSHRRGLMSPAESWPHLMCEHWVRAIDLAYDRVPQIYWPILPDPRPWPTVCVIIPTRNGLDLLTCCIEGVLATEYPGQMEVIVIDNDSDDPQTIDYLRAIAARGIRVLSCPGAFNFAAINNHAVAETGAELLCFLNNDIEITDGQWLAKLARHAVDPEVGAVGALLLYPDGSVQHSGVAIGVGGAAGHIYRGLRPTEEGNRFEHVTTRRVRAVTAACLVVGRAKFLAVGGFSANDFAVAFNDVDLCLKLERAGLRNVFEGGAVLIHHESRTRGNDMAPANRMRYHGELANLQKLWGTKDAVDPFHHPLINRDSEEFVLAP